MRLRALIAVMALLVVGPVSPAQVRSLQGRWTEIDEGATWPVSQVLHEGPAAYSGLTVLNDLSIGLLMERGERPAYEKITFVRFTLEWLTDGADAVRPVR